VELAQWWAPARALGLAWAGLLAGGRGKPALQSGLMLGFWLLSGLLGSVMLAMWLGTEHVYGHGNENLLHR